MGEYGQIRSPTSCPDRGQKGTVEPSPVLVTSLEIETGRKIKVFLFLKNGCIGNSRVKPDIPDVHLFCEIFSPALSTLGPFGQKTIGSLFKPDVRPLLLKKTSDMIDGPLIDQGLAAGGAIKDRNGNPPSPLPGDAPIRPILNHPVDSILSPRANRGHV